MDTKDLYNKLDKIFVDHTTHQWKNGWEHEGDRLSRELTIQKELMYNNSFLLQETSRPGIYLEGPDGFKIEIQNISEENIRIDIEHKRDGIDIYYYVDNEIDWISNQLFILDICQNIYDIEVKLRDTVSEIPQKLYGIVNPDFTRKWRRDLLLNELGI